MAWIDVLQSLNNAEAVLFLERTKRKLIEERNTRFETLTPAQKRAYDRDVFMPRIHRVLAILGARRNQLANDPKYDGQLDIREV